VPEGRVFHFVNCTVEAVIILSSQILAVDEELETHEMNNHARGIAARAALSRRHIHGYGTVRIETSFICIIRSKPGRSIIVDEVFPENTYDDVY
jgi:hypothetical protein